MMQENVIWIPPLNKFWGNPFIANCTVGAYCNTPLRRANVNVVKVERMDVKA
jgi:hypothetical protein